MSNATSLGAPLLPPIHDLRTVSAAVAIAVTKAAVDEGLAQVPVDNPIQQVHDAMWRPEYPTLETKPL
jgi:malate dehydrogenase (oxaloacetate-decarboxylating)